MGSLEVTGSRRPIVSASCWVGRDLSDTTCWSVTLSTIQRQAIVEAACAVAADGVTLATVEREQFDLPQLRAEVAEWGALLNKGRGFVLIRGFPVDELNENETELAYVGLGLQLGTPVSQNAHGDLLGHVRDTGVVRTDPSVRLYQTRERQDFHTDGADIVGLLCLQRAKAGGESRIASAATVYNLILERRPDLLEVLYEPMYWDRNGEESPGEDPYFAMPVLNDVAGLPRMFFIGWYIRDAQRHASVPRLTAAQSEAIELIEEIANDPAVHVEMDFQAGDIQWLSNARILHCREAYDDHPERRRHLLRLWLAARDFANVDEILRGGIPRRETAEPVVERS